MTAARNDVVTSSRHCADTGVLYREAAGFLELFYSARPRQGQLQTRLTKVRAEIAATGTYRHTEAELAFGARVALRDSGWCPRGVPWRDLLVRDLREVRDAAAVAAQCAHHLRMATAGGVVHPVVSVFAPNTPWRAGPCIRNEQLVRYAGYGYPLEVVGDRRHVEFTETACRLGWRPPGRQTAFDVLPLVVQTPHEGVTVHSRPRDAVLEVQLRHPELPAVTELNLRWHATPVVSSRPLHIGGIVYPAAPFNGVYLARSIGEDVLADEAGYGMAGRLARRLRLDTSSERTLWRQRAALELTRAVVHSFDAAGMRVELDPEDYWPAVESPHTPGFRRVT